MNDLANDLATINPDEIAYLRGSEKEVLGLRLFDLVQRGILTVVEDTVLLIPRRRLFLSGDVRRDSMTDFEATICGWFTSPRNGNEIRSFHWREPVVSACASCRLRLQADGLRKLPARWVLRLLGSLPLGLASSIMASDLVSGPTSAGIAYVSSLRQRFASLEKLPTAARLGVVDPDLVIAVALFGPQFLPAASMMRS